MHIYGNVVPEIRAVCAERHLALHEFGWQPAMERAGLRRDALYLLRPDGYVALAAPEQSAATLTASSGSAPSAFLESSVRQLPSEQLRLWDPAGQLRCLPNPARHELLVDLVVLVDVEVAHVLVLGLAGEERTQ